jgi:hypothetical protein
MHVYKTLDYIQYICYILHSELLIYLFFIPIYTLIYRK